MARRRGAFTVRFCCGLFSWKNRPCAARQRQEVRRSVETAYKTVRREAQAEFTEKRSRFIGRVRPVTTEAEAQEYIAALKKQYWDAAHTVYAYILRDGTRRFSDDGEPQGTAGMPTLEVLQKAGLTDAAVTVTRYFGGILLGAGGLVRAYSHAAALAVEAGEPVEMRPCRRVRVVCDYSRYGWVEPLLRSYGTVEGADFGEAVTVTAVLPVGACPGAQDALTERSAGQLVLMPEGDLFAPFEL